MISGKVENVVIDMLCIVDFCEDVHKNRKSLYFYYRTGYVINREYVMFIFEFSVKIHGYINSQMSKHMIFEQLEKYIFFA